MIYFLYGTLKKDHRLHFIVEQSDFLGEVETVDNSFDIKDFSYGAFPIVYRKEKEGFKINDAVSGIFAIFFLPALNFFLP